MNSCAIFPDNGSSLDVSLLTSMRRISPACPPVYMFAILSGNPLEEKGVSSQQQDARSLSGDATLLRGLRGSLLLVYADCRMLDNMGSMLQEPRANGWGCCM
jgi:hypothetical protein